MADVSKRGAPDDLGAWYLTYPAGENKAAFRWRIEYESVARAGGSPGDSPVVDSAVVAPADVFKTVAAALSAAKAYAAKRAAADAPPPAKGRGKKAPAAPAEPPAEDGEGDSPDNAPEGS